MKLEHVHSHYIPHFDDNHLPFLHYYRIGADKQLQCKSFTRHEFLQLSYRAVSVLVKNGLKPGDHFINCFGANQYQDLAFRLAAVMTGTIPATVNWQADTLDRVMYKIDSTEAKLILHDNLFDPEMLDALKKHYAHHPFANIEELDDHEEHRLEEIIPVRHEDPRIVIFTSGTTGMPKGVRLPYSAYHTNHQTFETLLSISPTERLAFLIVNPLHHTNSTAITDWAMRRPGAEIHMVERYSTQYWALKADISRKGYCRIVAPLVAKHFDFLEALHLEDKLPVDLNSLSDAMSKVDYLIGSAPVGPTTIKRLLKYAKRVPTVRFGSTETCLQVLGIPVALDETTKMNAFESGWNHQFQGRNIVGYYIGRPTPPFTECRIVKSIERGKPGYFVDCEEGEPGYLVTRGRNLMSGYLNNPEATDEVFHDGGWYSGLKDICFGLKNQVDGEVDYFWQGRDSFILIKGGANYAYDQINAELSDVVEQQFGLNKNQFEIAVVGLRLKSEHEDECFVTMQLNENIPGSLQNELQKNFISTVKSHVSKGAAPDFFRFGEIPKNFKGAILVSDLKESCLEDYQKQVGDISEKGS